MPVWLLSALNMLRAATIGTPVRALATGAGAALAVSAGAEEAGFVGGDLLGGLFGEEVKKRRRRRKALTADDLRLALIIASSISKKASENFILSRVRSG